MRTHVAFKAKGFCIRKNVYRSASGQKVHGPEWFYRKSPEGDEKSFFAAELCSFGDAHLAPGPLKFIGYAFPQGDACNPI